MKKTKLPTRALSCVLACALTFTMTPAAALAVEPADDASSSSSADAAIEVVAEDGTEEASVPEMHTQEVPVAVAAEQAVEGEEAAESEEAVQHAEAAEPAAPAKEDLEILTSSVSLDADAPATVLTHNGLVYQVNSDDPNTVAFVGISSAATDTITIPSAIQTAEGALSVTKIIGGGGSLIS